MREYLNNFRLEIIDALNENKMRTSMNEELEQQINNYEQKLEPTFLKNIYICMCVCMTVCIKNTVTMFAFFSAPLIVTNNNKFSIK